MNFQVIQHMLHTYHSSDTLNYTSGRAQNAAQAMNLQVILHTDNAGSTQCVRFVAAFTRRYCWCYGVRVVLVGIIVCASCRTQSWAWGVRVCLWAWDRSAHRPQLFRVFCASGCGITLCVYIHIYILIFISTFKFTGKCKYVCVYLNMYS